MSNDQAKNLRELVSKEKNCKTILFISGKERVGKTMTITNIGTLLSEMGYRTLILDCGAGFFRTDVLLNTVPKYGIKTVINNNEPIEDIMVSINENLKVIYGRPLLEEIQSSKDILIKIEDYFKELQNEFDFILVDTEKIEIRSFSGLLKDSSSVLFVLTTDDIDGVKSTYTILKQVASYTDINDIGLIVNKVKDYMIANDVYERLRTTSEKFLSIKISNIGYISDDISVSESIREQTPVTRLYERSKISNEFNEIISRIKVN
ncbi:flagellar biosynthesis protein FlhG [Gottschalkia acidurici 9a]|uniref:Flagellar biosynthesis protein FlhG n=1 Tax=Gottschalkia acidurici (strain ATCC 7906 / DSM 604 / BCRC 14475 / CIP 104303 / KCTC 5404 / NCIMB 10678 / 9a) TaxID=1128398 RepID=K0AXP3_GOTA9|nr:AAA family ATPase [Gottschalkia acidurici]AFS78588.1 flagellar biosynthesis protein FlhG [Gottschalkia acidurici 9a]